MTEIIRPTLKALISRITADIDARLPAALSRPAKSVINVLATVLSGAFHSLYGFVEWMQQQTDPLTANEYWLGIWASRLDVPRREATVSTGTVTFSAETETSIPSDTLFRNTAGVQFRTINAGVTGEAIAAESLGKGQSTRLQQGETLTLETSIEGVALNPVYEGFQNGSDIETLEEWAQRIASRIAERQKIGDKDDYKSWVLQAHPDIADAWIQENTPTLGSITARVLVGSDSPFPSNSVLAAAQSQLDDIRNAGATTYVLAPLQQEIGLKVAGIAEENKASIVTEIDNFLSRKRYQNAEIYPEELERIIGGFQQGFTLLLPYEKLTAANNSLFVTGEVQWA